jgi:hypothetical protein
VKQIALIFVLFLSVLSVQAQQSNSCGLSLQGPIDTIPWKYAQPFPWDDIQGLWKISNEPDYVIRMRVTRKDTDSRKLQVEVLSRSKCRRVMRGPGIINGSEKDVVRISLVDQQGVTRLMKLAFFDTRDLKMDANICGQSVLAASVIDIDHESDDLQDVPNTGSQKALESKSNMMLKKITDSTDFYCRKNRN